MHVSPKVPGLGGVPKIRAPCSKCLGVACIMSDKVSFEMNVRNHESTGTSRVSWYLLSFELAQCPNSFSDTLYGPYRNACFHFGRCRGKDL